MKTKIVTTLILAFSLTACNAVESKNSGGGVQSAQQSLETIDLESLNPELDDMELKLAEASKEMNALSLTNITSIGSSTGAEAKAQGLADKIAEVLNKEIDVVEKVAVKKKEIRAKIDAAAAKLDPSMPNYAQLKQRVDEMLSYLDKLDAEIVKVQGQLVSLIDSKVAAIDAAIAKMSPTSPLTWIVSIAWQTVKVKIVAARDRLAAIQF